MSSCRGGSIENITSQKSFAGTLWYATCRALLENSETCYPDMYLHLEREFSVGGAFESCATLAKAAREVFDFMKVEFVESSSTLWLLKSIESIKSTFSLFEETRRGIEQEINAEVDR